MKFGIVYHYRAGNTKQAAEVFEEKLKEKKIEGFIMDIFYK